MFFFLQVRLKCYILYLVKRYELLCQVLCKQISDVIALLCRSSDQSFFITTYCECEETPWFKIVRKSCKHA